MAQPPGQDTTPSGTPSRSMRALLGGAGLGALLGLGLGWSIGHGPVAAPAASVARYLIDDAGPRGSTPASAAADSSAEPALDAKLADARRLMAMRAWDSPPDDCVSAVLEGLRKQWNADPRVDAIRHEAAERALADAVGLGSAHRAELAARRVRLALEWVPELPGARDLLTQLEHAGPSASSDGFELAPLPTRLPDRSPPLPANPLSPPTGEQRP